ncbi:MAG: D-2-hydroxyacid dehydrogenase [Bryobacterales bacterium]|nr:D-2-hydroxyacid dehydrogenase [Bryobacterales bacterium]
MAHTILVLADPTERELALLEQLPSETTVAVGNQLDAFARTAGQADVIFSWSYGRSLLAPLLEMAPNVRWIHSRSAGLDSVLFPELIASPVPLTNGRGVFSQSLGEFALAAVLYFAKDLRRMIRNQMAGRWDQFDVDEISTQTLGIVGYGDIGRAIAQRAKAMGMQVLAVRRNPARSNGDAFVDEVHGMDELLPVLARCDHIAVAAPLTPDTQGLIGERAIDAMKPTATLINVGRGPVIDEAALIAALRAQRIKGAALDVFDEEPLPAGHPYYSMENLLLSPHCADHTSTWLADAMRFFLEQFERYRKGEPLENIVDKQAGY